VANKDDPPKTLGDIFPSRISFHHSLSRPQQLRSLLSRWEELRREPTFLKACDAFFEGKPSSLVRFFDEWKTYPIPSFVLAPETFRRAAEEVAEKAGEPKPS
jgi:hypothetical protein